MQGGVAWARVLAERADAELVVDHLLGAVGGQRKHGPADFQNIAGFIDLLPVVSELLHERAVPCPVQAEHNSFRHGSLLRVVDNLPSRALGNDAIGCAVQAQPGRIDYGMLSTV